MSGDLVIEHIKGTLSYVHDETIPTASALLLIHSDIGADIYVRHSGYMHRFIGRVPDELRLTIKEICKRGLVVHIPVGVVEGIDQVRLIHLQEREVRPSVSAEIVALWFGAARKYGMSRADTLLGEEYLFHKLSEPARFEGLQAPFPDLLGMKLDLEGNGSFEFFKEVIGQPAGGLAGIRTTEALRVFFATALVRN